MTTSDATVRPLPETTVIDLVGDIDSHAEGSLERAWDEAMATSPTTVSLNFRDAGYINSTGIALIVGLLAKARARGIPLRAHGLTPHYREIFEITRLADFMAIEPDDTTSATAGAAPDRAEGAAPDRAEGAAPDRAEGAAPDRAEGAAPDRAEGAGGSTT